MGMLAGIRKQNEDMGSKAIVHREKKFETKHLIYHELLYQLMARSLQSRGDYE